MMTSVTQDIEEKWDVTGDNGLSRSSLIILRVMTAAFFVGTLFLVFLFLGLFDTSGWPVRLQAMQMVVGMVIGFVLLGLWSAISIHPLCGPPPKALKATLYLGYLFGIVVSSGYLKQVYEFFSDWVVNPILLSFGLPLIIAAIGLIPITRLAWTTPLRITDD